MKSESIKQITQAIISVMNEVKGIDKTMTIGSGPNAYKGVPDKEVKKAIGSAMSKHGLAILPISVVAKTSIERWSEETSYGPKQKQSVFTEVNTDYLLTHLSGEFITISGYGHGTDSQDKSAGKATTYALKYALLYTFLTPTGSIDDSDSTHSDEIQTPKELLFLNGELFKKAKKFIQEGGHIDDIKKKYQVTKEIETLLNEK